MKLSYFAFLALLGGFAFFILFIADRERKAGAERLSVYRIPHSALEEPSLKHPQPRQANRALAGNASKNGLSLGLSTRSELLAGAKTNPKLKADLQNQATAYRKLAAERTKQLEAEAALLRRL